VSIRPEHLKFSSEASPDNCGRATLVSSTNLGATVRHRLTAGGHELQVRELSSDASVRPASGGELFVAWEPDKAQLLVLEQ